MRFIELSSAMVRKEDFGGIIYFPSRNTQIAMNDELYGLISCIKHAKSLPDAVRAVVQSYDIDKKSAKKILTHCLSLFLKEIENYRESHDEIVDWKVSPQSMGGIKLSAPLMLIVEVTKACNQRCSFCYQATEISDMPELTSDLIYKIIDQAKEMGVLKIQYMGGEPLCRNDFINILSYTDQKGIFTSFTTNGVYIDSVINELVKIKRLLPIQISIHGDSAYCAGSYGIKEEEWKKALSNCTLLKNNNIPFGIKAVISRLNYKEIFNLTETFSQLGAKTVTFLHLLPIGGGKNMAKEAKFTKDEVGEIVRLIQVSKKSFPSIHIDYRPFLNVYFPKQPKTRLDELINCPAGRLDLRIRYDGKVLQCSSLRIPLDDVKIHSLKKIWESVAGRMLPCPYECNKAFQYAQDC